LDTPKLVENAVLVSVRRPDMNGRPCIVLGGLRTYEVWKDTTYTERKEVTGYRVIDVYGDSFVALPARIQRRRPAPEMARLKALIFKTPAEPVV
jgi:hypothetical protein